MKKQILAFAAIGVAACCLGACTKVDKDKDNSFVNEYDNLNAMLNANYSQIEITVTDTFDENTSLKSDYIIKYSDSQIKVEYSVEEFAEVSLDGTSDLITTLKGEAVIKDGAISFDGDKVGITADIAKLGLNFNENFFTNAQLTGNYFIADVEFASAFLGSAIECSSMKVNATFFEVFYDIQITYVSESGNNVEYTYIFTL